LQVNEQTIATSSLQIKPLIVTQTAKTYTLSLHFGHIIF